MTDNKGGHYVGEANTSPTMIIMSNLPAPIIFPEFEISPPPASSVGHYKVGYSNMSIHLGHKPRWLTRFAMAVVFQLYWHDE